MGGLSIGLSALCLGLLWGLLRQRQKTKKLYRQMEAFLDGQKAPLEISLGESPSARLQNAAARLENALLHAREQTRLEARRSENLLTDISHQLKTPLASLQLFVELDQGAHLEQEQVQLERMQALISGLLRLERLCADGYAFHFESHDLLELVGSCWQPLASGCAAMNFITPIFLPPLPPYWPAVNSETVRRSSSGREDGSPAAPLPAISMSILPSARPCSTTGCGQQGGRYDPSRLVCSLDT